jgi:DNA-binding response OmpR family regulator
MKVLIIEDDQSIIDAVKLAFEFRWPEVELFDAKLGNKGITMVKNESPDIVILDINLPDINGFDVLKKIREFSMVPVIILTVRSEDEDVMQGLEAGADDYIIKPFNYLTLLARVKAVLRRTKMIPFKGSQNNLINARVSIDFVNQKVIVDNRLIKLTPIEYKLLVIMVKNKNNTVPYNTITSEIWGKNYDSDTGNIRLTIRRLRKKMKDSPPQMILNKRGSGYIFKS